MLQHTVCLCSSLHCVGTLAAPPLHRADEQRLGGSPRRLNILSVGPFLGIDELLAVVDGQVGIAQGNSSCVLERGNPPVRRPLIRDYRGPGPTSRCIS